MPHHFCFYASPGDWLFYFPPGISIHNNFPRLRQPLSSLLTTLIPENSMSKRVSPSPITPDNFSRKAQKPRFFSPLNSDNHLEPIPK